MNPRRQQHLARCNDENLKQPARHPKADGPFVRLTESPLPPEYRSPQSPRRQRVREHIDPPKRERRENRALAATQPNHHHRHNRNEPCAKGPSQRYPMLARRTFHINDIALTVTVHPPMPLYRRVNIKTENFHPIDPTTEKKANQPVADDLVADP